MSNKQLDRSLRYQISALGLLIDQKPLAIIAVAVSAVVYAYCSLELVPVRHLQLWFGVVVARIAAGIYWHAYWSHQLQSEVEVRKATTWLYVLATWSAALWGIGGSLLLNNDSLEHFVITLTIVAGIAAGSTGAYAADLRLSVIFLCVLLLPFSARLVLEQRAPFVEVGLLCLVFWILMMLVARNSNRHLSRSIEIGLDNEDLAGRLSAASHEIRTPVAVISGFADILADQLEVQPMARQYVQIIRRNCSYLKRLVDNVLVISRAEAGISDEVYESVRVREQVTMALDVIRNKAQQKGLAVAIEFADNVPERARLQTIKFQQILINLLTNAVKFTNEGGIDVRVELSRGAELVTRVSDTGIGIQSENVERVFQPFFRENRNKLAPTEGSGLGLALSRGLAQSMGGDLVLINGCGKGCVFELRIPLNV